MKWMQTHPVLTFVVVAILTSLFCLSMQWAVTYVKVHVKPGSRRAADTIDDVIPSGYDNRRTYADGSGPGYLIRSAAGSTLESTAKMQPTGERPVVPELLYTKSTHTRL